MNLLNSVAKITNYKFHYKNNFTMADKPIDHNFILSDSTEPKLIRPKNIARLIIILSVLCLSTFYCGYTLAYIAALGMGNVAIVYG